MTTVRKFSPLFFSLLFATLAGCSMISRSPPKSAVAPSLKLSTVLQPCIFDDLPGWKTDDLREVWPAFLASCTKLAPTPTWRKPCADARAVRKDSNAALHNFFEAHFQPYKAHNPDGGATGLMTGYYEPLLRGARKRGGPFQTPLYRKPDDLIAIDLLDAHPELNGSRLRGRLVGKTIHAYPSRADITGSGMLKGKEILWVDDPVDAFFLQVQGSGRVYLPESGKIVRLAYADQNGHPYQSIGRYLVSKGELTLDQASAQGIKDWLKAHPERINELFNANPSYVFFREEAIVDRASGPKGALGVPLTAERSVAVDPAHIALGTPVFIATTHPASQKPLRRLTIAQDTGSAIKGESRLDYFWGYGKLAGESAGRTKQEVAVWLLLPKQSN